MTNSSVLLPDPNVDIKKKVENVVNAVIGEDHGGVTIVDKKFKILMMCKPSIIIS
jgi:hypothetical protein